jgi:mannose/fructose-specific phosphotransferase system component IIA
VVSTVQRQYIAGVNLPMLLRAANYCNEDLNDLSAIAMDGGANGMVYLK